MICEQFSVHETLNIADISQTKFEVYETFDEDNAQHKFTKVAPLKTCETTEPTPATPSND